MAEMTRLQNSRKAYKSHVTRTFRKVDELMAIDVINELQLSSLKTSQELLIQKKETIHQLDTQILEGTENPDNLEDLILEIEETQDRLLEKINQLDTFIKLRTRASTESPSSPVIPPLSTSSSPTTTESTIAESHVPTSAASTTASINPTTTVTTYGTSPLATPVVLPTLPPTSGAETAAVTHPYPQATSRLPKLTLPIFSGDPLSWQTFWDSFSAAVDSSPSLGAIQKFNYLRAQLQGDAARTIAGLPLTEANYSQSVLLLKERFGQPGKIQNAHMLALLETPSPTNELSSLRLFYDSVEVHIRGLSSLGISKETYGTLLVPIILSKLPVPTLKNLAREHANLDWSIEELQAAVLKEIRVLETGFFTGEQRSNTPRGSHSTAAFLTGIKGTRNNPPPYNRKKKQSCVYCKGDHFPSVCEVVTDVQKRLEIVKRGNLCYNCLGNHKVSHCNSKFRCKICKHKHHTSLCEPITDASKPNDKSNTEAKTTNPSTQTNQPPQTSMTMAPVSYDSQSNKCPPTTHTISLLKTAIAPISANGSRIQGNILFDDGSQRSFITEEVATKLNLKPFSTELIAVAPFGAEYTSSQRLSVACVCVETESGERIPITVLIVPFIAAPLQNSVRASINSFQYLKGLKLAHPVTNDNNFQISVLIGADFYWTFVQDNIVRGQGPTAQQSKLGYLLSGPLHQVSLHPIISAFHVAIMQLTIEDPNLQQFWSLEEAGTSQHTTQERDGAFLHNYQTTSISQAEDGTYTARFPWKSDHPHLPTNFTVCERRTRSLLARLTESPSLLHLYNNIISDQVKRGFIERLSSDHPQTQAHYLPHHPVKKDSVTTPIRVVFDGSCRQGKGSASLNDCLLVGPPFLNDLCSILLRFRVPTFAFATDIEKAFLHVKLHKSDMDYTRFLWPSDIANPAGDLATYRFKVVPFGTTSSPFMLNAVIDLHLSKYPSQVARDMKTNLYVDNLISGCNSEDEAIDYYQQSRCIMNAARFNLRSWSSNSSRLRSVIVQDNTNDPSTTVNVLGLRWDTLKDTLSFTPRHFQSLTSTSLVTKREILRDSAQIYDPLGLIAPITVKAKILVQTLWKQKIDWDEPLDQDSTNAWSTIAEDIKEATTIVYPRLYFVSQNQLSSVSTQLHIFTDASLRAYGAVVYLRQNNSVALVMSRSRVTPTKMITLPRLELMAAVTGVRLANFVIASMRSKLNSFTTFLWSDSQIVLHWIHHLKLSTQSKPFIANRIQEIRNSFPVEHWTYVPTADNPADLLTRGLSTQQLRDSRLWLYGPSWLPSQTHWPTWSPTNVLSVQTEETTDVVPNCASTSDTRSSQSYGLHYIIDISRYGQLNKVLSITSYVLRFCANLRHPSNKVLGPITAQELSTARMLWIKTCQSQLYEREITNLQDRSSKRLLLVRQLRLFLDNHGLLRCGGRIHNAPISELAKFPYLLPANHEFTKLLVYATHVKLCHAGVNSTVTALRQSYWIPAIRQCVKKILRKCVACIKVFGKPYRVPDPPPLPKLRINQPNPFEVTGIDFTGALYVRDNGSERKVYICLFTCATTRAVHLEVVLDLTLESFMLAFRKFSSRRSTPATIISDNASTYLAAAEELTRLFQSSSLKTALEYHGVTWKFIPKRAPWYGGFWERLVGLTKQSLRKVLGRAFVSLPVLQTTVVEIEAVLNDRPLTYVSSDVRDVEPLTPAHLLCGRRITSLPHEHEENLDDPDYVDATTMRKQVDKHTRILNHFKSRWKREYLTSLREFHKACGHNKQLVKKGDVVLIHDEKPRLNWKLAVIEDLLMGNDGCVRAANVRTGNYVTSRPISKLYPLEVSSTDSNLQREVTRGELNKQSTNSQPTDTNKERPRRKAAEKARSQISEWTKELCRPPEDVEK